MAPFTLHLPGQKSNSGNMPAGARLDSPAAGMAELQPPYTSQQAVVEAQRCLFCFDAPCIQACPTGIDVPSFIRKIAHGNPVAAARTILSANILGASCARVCPTEVLCEGACVVLSWEGDPVKIGRLQRHATDYVFEQLDVAGDRPGLAEQCSALRILGKPAASSGKRVAIIGGGPAGLGCAAELAQLGHQAVVFEKRPRAGGLNTHGVAVYKMKPATGLAEVELVKSLGVEFRCGVEVGRDISVAQLEKEFDAIFIGMGFGGGLRLGIPGGDLPEVITALDFIEQIHTRPAAEVRVGKRVAVIGGGNTAIDAVTQARRLGAPSATVIYHRGENDLPAYPFEYELAKRDGAQFLFNAAALEILAEEGRVSALRLARTRVNDAGALETVPGSEWVEPFDMVIEAIGQEKQTETLRRHFPALEFDERGAVQCHAVTGRTNLPRVFAGGDCANGGHEVVHAVADGKRAARGIHAMFSGETVTGPVQPSRLGVAGGAFGSGLDYRRRFLEQHSQSANDGVVHG
jgi:glutamate synthase (NADPH/NADH) small chain